MRLLVTGGAGFIGANFIRYMLDKYEDCEIVNFDKLTYAGNLDNLRGIEDDPRYRFVKGDIADRRTVASIFREHRPQAVVNFAAESNLNAAKARNEGKFKDEIIPVMGKKEDGTEFLVENDQWIRDNPDIEKHIFMLNLDMVGRLKSYPKKDDVENILEELFPKYPFAKNITFREERASDHSSFYKEMPVVWIFTGTHRDYHKRTDTSEKLNYLGMVMICDYVYEIVTKIVDSEIPRYILWRLPVIEK